MMTVQLAVKQLESLDTASLEHHLDMSRRCMQLVCSKLSLVLQLEKTCSCSKILPHAPEASLTLLSEFAESFLDTRRGAKIFMLNQFMMPKPLLVVSREEVETEDDLLKLLRAKLGGSKTDDASIPACCREQAERLEKALEATPAMLRCKEKLTDELHELAVLRVLEELLASERWWIIAHSHYDIFLEKHVLMLLEGSFPKFCEQPEFTMRLAARGVPEFKPVLV